MPWELVFVFLFVFAFTMAYSMYWKYCGFVFSKSEVAMRSGLGFFIFLLCLVFSVPIPVNDFRIVNGVVTEKEVMSIERRYPCCPEDKNACTVCDEPMKRWVLRTNIGSIIVGETFRNDEPEEYATRVAGDPVVLYEEVKVDAKLHDRIFRSILLSGANHFLKSDDYVIPYPSPEMLDAKRVIVRGTPKIDGKIEDWNYLMSHQLSNMKSSANVILVITSFDSMSVEGLYETWRLAGADDVVVFVGNEDGDLSPDWVKVKHRRMFGSNFSDKIEDYILEQDALDQETLIVGLLDKVDTFYNERPPVATKTPLWISAPSLVLFVFLSIYINNWYRRNGFMARKVGDEIKT